MTTPQEFKPQEWLKEHIKLVLAHGNATFACGEYHLDGSEDEDYETLATMSRVSAEAVKAHAQISSE